MWPLPASLQNIDTDSLALLQTLLKRAVYYEPSSRFPLYDEAPV